MNSSSEKNSLRIPKQFFYFFLIVFVVIILTTLYKVWDAYKTSLTSSSRIVVQTAASKHILYRNTPQDMIEMPSDIPQNLPIYPYLTGNIEYASGTNNPGLSAESSDDIKTIYHWFLDELPKMDWTITDKSYSSVWKAYDIFFENAGYSGRITITNKDRDSELSEKVRIHEYVKKK